MTPSVSICIPTYNGALFLEEALNSVKAQTYKDFEIIISDDSSKDITLEIIKAFKKSVDFPVHVYNHIPNGIGANWNHCLQKANGNYIKFLFQDDVMEPDCLEKMVGAFENNPELALVASKRQFIVEDDLKHIKDMEKWLKDYENLQCQFDDIKDNLLLDKSLFKRLDFLKSPLNKIGEPTTVMFKRALVNEIGWFRTDLKQLLDYEYWYRIIKHYPALVLNEPLVKFRVHALQETQKNKSRTIDDYQLYYEILRKEYADLLHPKVLNELQPQKRYRGYYFLKRLRQQIKHIFS